MFKERFFIFKRRGPENRDATPGTVSPAAKRQEQGALLQRAKEGLGDRIEETHTGERAPVGEEVAVDLVTANISAAVIPELMEQLLNGEVKANGNDVVQTLIEACDQSRDKKKHFKTILTLVETNAIKAEHLVNTKTISLLTKNLKEESDLATIFNKITSSRSATKKYIENCQNEGEKMDLIFKHLKRNTRPASLDEGSIKLLIRHFKDKGTEGQTQINELLATFSAKPHSVITILKVLKGLEDGQKQIRVIFDKYKKNNGLKTLPLDAVAFFIENLENPKLDIINNFHANSAGHYFSDKQLYRTIRDNLLSETSEHNVCMAFRAIKKHNTYAQASIAMHYFNDGKQPRTRFKQYIDKFSNTDKLKVIKILPAEDAKKLKKTLPASMQSEGKPIDLLAFRDKDVEAKFIAEMGDILPDNIVITPSSKQDELILTDRKSVV